MPVDDHLARCVALEQAYVHDVYEQFQDNPIRSKPWAKVQQFLEDLEPGSLVCDVGCGNGKYLNANPSIFNLGGDKSTRLVEAARDKENEVLILDNLTLPYKDESLDAVLSIAVIHHLATTDRRICALRELSRVLRIGGRLIISVWAMEQSHRKFESQDVLVPWHRPKHLSTPSLELTTSTTTNTSEDDCLAPYHAYTQTSDSDSNRSSVGPKVRKKGKFRHKGRSIDPEGGGGGGINSTPSSSSLSSPNETCYSFVRRAIQKLAGSRRVAGRVHRPWFLENWSNGPRDQRAAACYNEDCCRSCCECTDENIQDLPIELRRVDDDEFPHHCRRQTFPSSQLINDITSNSLKSRSMTNIKTSDNNVPITLMSGENSMVNLSKKPKLVKQKKSICEEDDEEALDQPTDMKSLIRNLPDFKVFQTRSTRSGVFKQRSFNEELMGTDRLKEKERVRQNIQKQASLNEDLIYQQRHQHAFDSFKDSFFSVSTSKRFQLIKTGFTNKIKNSSTIEKVTSTSLKNGFVKMFQNWKSSDLISPPIPEHEATTFDLTTGQQKVTTDLEEKKESITERRHSKEDGSDSSKDSSLQSDTSVDSEDSFASVIFVPKSDPISPTNMSPAGPISPRWKASSVPNSPRIKQSSCPTSPRIKQMPLAVYPLLTKQLSSPKPSSTSDKVEHRDHSSASSSSVSIKAADMRAMSNLAQKYSVPQIPQFRRTHLNSDSDDAPAAAALLSPPDKETRTERLKKIKELLTQKPGFGSKTKPHFPIVRQSSVSNGKVEAIGKPLPKLLSLELFNPETDDKDSDSSCVSSPDSVGSVINMRSKARFKFPPEPKNSLKMASTQEDEVVVARNGPSRKCINKSRDMLSIIYNRYNAGSWDEDCHKHLSDFADKLSEKLLQEIDQYQQKSKERTLNLSNSMDNIDDPYISRLSEELDDLSKLSAEIQKQNEYLAQLGASDSLFNQQCGKCMDVECKCNIRKTTVVTKNTTNASCGGAHHEFFESRSPDPNSNESLDGKHTPKGDFETGNSTLSVSRTSIRMGTSTDSCDSDRGSSTNSMVSSVATSINFGQSIESSGDGGGGGGGGGVESHKDRTSSISRYSDGGSTASLASCPDWKSVKARELTNSSASLESDSLERRHGDKSVLLSDNSQDSLPSDNVGGEITYHRYYHVFREGELDQLIEKYVENLHIISSYYDHASWCIIAEKVQVWTI